MQEHDIQNAIRLRLSSLGRSVIFRGNVGQAWTGSSVEKLPGGDVIIRNARPFKTGLPPGFPDLFGFTLITVNPDMIGMKIPAFTAIEVKQPGKNPSRAQAHCLDFLLSKNCLAGVAHDEDEAESIIDAY